jgi:PEP-CTERM motif
MKKTTFAALALASALSLQATPVYIWAVTENAYLARVDATTGATTVVGNTGTMLNDIAIDNNGDMWGIDHTTFYKVNKATGALTAIGNHSIQNGAGLGVAADGFTILGVGSGTQFLFTMNLLTGASTAIGGVGMGTEASGDVATNNGRLFMSSAGVLPQNHVISEIDLATGERIGAFGVTEYGAGVWPGKGLTSGSDGVLYLGSLDKVYAINTTVGPNFGQAISSVTMDVAGLGQIRGLASEVPEPGTMALFGFGLIALGLARRNR